MNPEYTTEIFFHVIAIYNGNDIQFSRTLNFIYKQHEKQFALHISIHPDNLNHFERNYSGLSQYKLWTLHQSHYSPLENVNTLVTILKRIDFGWICMIKPGDEWYPYHLSAFRDAIIQNPGYRFYHTLNYAEGLTAIKAINPDKNRIHYHNLKLKDKTSLSQIAIHHQSIDYCSIPDLKIDTHYDLLFKLIFMSYSPLVRINRFTCNCRQQKQLNSKEHFDQLILVISYLIRNVIKDNKVRLHLLLTTWKKSVTGSLKRAKFFTALVLFKEMLCCYVGIRKGIKGGQMYVD